MDPEKEKEFFKLCSDIVKDVWLGVPKTSILEVLGGENGDDDDLEKDDSEFRLCFCNEGKGRL